MWSWKGHVVIVVLLSIIAGAITGLVKAKVLDLGTDSGPLPLSHEDVEKDFLILLWASVGAFTVASTLLLAAGLRKGIATALPYVVGVAAIPATWVFLDKYI